MKTIKIQDNDDDLSTEPAELFIEEGELGAGGFSTVLLATKYNKDGSSNQVAIKRINCCDTEQIKNAMHEIEITKKISSPHVISLLQHGISQSDVNPNHKVVSLVFPVYHGGTLWDFLIKRRDEKAMIPFEQKLSIATGMIKGLKRCHGLGIAHCDLKTANILLKRDLKSAVIMDLGSSTVDTLKSINTHHETQVLQDWAAEKCTACYRAPELFHIEYPAVVDLKKSDIWSIGCCLYALNYWQGPLDEIWLRGDSLGLAVQSIEKYTKNLGSQTGESAIFDKLTQLCLKYNNASRASCDDLLTLISANVSPKSSN